MGYSDAVKAKNQSLFSNLRKISTTFMLLFLLFTSQNASAYGYPYGSDFGLTWDKCLGAVTLNPAILANSNKDNLRELTVRYRDVNNVEKILLQISEYAGTGQFATMAFDTYSGKKFYVREYAAGLTCDISNIVSGRNTLPTTHDIQMIRNGNCCGGIDAIKIFFYKLPPDIKLTNGSFDIKADLSWWDENDSENKYYGTGWQTFSKQVISAPQGLSATQNNCGTVDLSWSMPFQNWQSSSSCTNFGSYTTNIYRNGTLIKAGVTNTAAYIDTTSLVPGVEYNYTATVIWTAYQNTRSYIESSVSNSVIGKIKDYPNQVPNVVASDNLCNKQIKIDWGWFEQNPQDFLLYKNGALLATLTGGIRTYTDTAVIRGTTYTYDVKARNNCSLVSPSSTETGLSPADPALATNVGAVYDGITQKVNVSWTDNATNETSYEIIRQDDLGNTIYFSMNPNTTSYLDDGVSTCRQYTYKVKVISSCVTGGLISTSQSTIVVPPPNISSTFDTIKKITGSKGYFTNRVELAWSVNNAQNLDQVKIYRKILGTTDSVLITSQNPSSGLYIDLTAEARVFYEYTMIGEKNCNGTVLYSNITKDVGFRNPLGMISGHIEYAGGIAVKDVKVSAEASTGDAGYSLKFTGGAATALDKAALEPGNELRLETWIRPINAIDGPIVNKSGAFAINKSGTNYAVTITTTVSTYTVNIPQTSLPIGTWKNISVQYNGTNMFVLVNGIQVGSTPATGSIVDNASNLVIAGGANHFYLDEFRMMGVAVDSTKAARDFGRYFNGNESGFKVSLHNDEGVGNYSYDVSRNGNIYNANHFALTGSYAWDVIRPSSAQLNYSAYTDSLGNYIISGVRFNGFGDNFTVVPSFGVHSFSPNSRSVYLGDQTLVFTNQDFTDISSFVVTGTVFYKMPNASAPTLLPVPDVGILVDGLPVIKNGQQLKSDATGAFTISVPIGEHNVKADLYAHDFEVGRFPATGEYDFQGPVSGIAFLDTTTRIIKGRVVGGTIQANKAIGMNRSKNNIGTAQIKLSSPVVGTSLFTTSAITDTASGEYTFKIPPVQYRVDSINVLSNYNLINKASFPNGNQQFDLRLASTLEKVVDTLYGTGGSVLSIDSAFYNVRRDFVKRNTPTIDLLRINGSRFIGEDSLSFGGTMMSINTGVAPSWGPFTYPVFVQGNQYNGKVIANELYINTDNNLVDTVPLNGSVLITNNIAATIGSTLNMVNGTASYSFTAGDPNISTNSANPAFSYTKTLQLSVVPEGAVATVYTPNTALTPSFPEYRGYVMGIKATGTGVATQGPEKLDYILRDPAGSGSSATWSSGQEMSISKNYSRGTTSDNNLSAKILTGTSGSVGAGYSTNIEVDNNIGLGLSTTKSKASTNGITETITSNQTVSTQSSSNYVGADADIFIGRSRNWLVGPTANIELVDSATCGVTVQNCFGTSVNGKRLAVLAGYTIAPGNVKTRFSYTQSEIETVVIPTLEALRATKLATALYVNHLPIGSPMFGANNDDPGFLTDGDPATNPTTTTPTIYEDADKTGPSYTYNGVLTTNRDTVRVLNTQIALWKQALAQNEREKWAAINNTGGVLIDNFTLGSAIVTNSYSTNKTATSTSTWELNIADNVNFEIGAEIAGIGASLESSLTVVETSGGEESQANTSTTSFQYTLTDGDPGDIFSIDVYKSSEGTGNIFVTRGGRSMCPYEGAVKPHYFDPANPYGYIGSHTYIANPTATIQLATIQREIPNIDITPAQQFNIPSNQAAVFQLLLTNQSPETVNNDIDMKVRVASQSNPNGAVVKIDGLSPNTLYTIPAGASVVKTLTVERGPVYVEYDSLMIIFSSNCSDAIADTAYISVHFIPTCTEVALSNPTNNWILNNANNNQLDINISNYNYNYGAATIATSTGPVNLGLNKIGFELKPATSSSWTQIEQFLKYPGVNDSTISTSNIYTNYPWNVSTIPDGNYELRAKTYCLNFDGTYSSLVSPVYSGVMDRINPQPFGTPSPADGILDPNDDISIQFNENLDLGAIGWPNFQVRGVLNGTDLRHAEFVNFDGVNDFVEVPGGVGLQRKNFTIEFWSRLNVVSQDQTVISQGIDPNESMSVGFTSGNNLILNINGQTVQSNGSIANPTQWNHFAAVYSIDDNEALLYQNGTLLNSGSTSLSANYNGSGKMYMGKKMPQNTNHFQGNLHEVRVWNTKRTAGELVVNLNKVLNSNVSGLVHNWQMNEANGLIIQDQIRERNAVMNGANWQIDPNGFSGQFNGSSAFVNVNASTIPITKNMDATIEFWFNSTQASAATLFSSGKGDGVGADSLVGWEINKDATGKIHVLHKGIDFVAVDSNYFDGNWHHFALVLNRNANLSAYIDGQLKNGVQAINYKGISGPNFTIGARGYTTSLGAYAQDKFFQGSLDEVRVWNVARKFEQIKRDKNNRMKGDEYGLLAHVPFESYTLISNVPVLTAQISNNAPAFPSALATQVGGVTTSNQTPVIKLPRPVENVNFSWLLNGDKIVISPTTSQELLENQTIDITVKDVYDGSGNKMESPKTWIAYFNKNQVYWENDLLEFEIKVDSNLQFTGKIVNTGGASKTFNLSGLPSWLSANITSGVIAPNSQQFIQFSVIPGLNVGEYYGDIAVTTDFNYAEVLRVSLKVNGTPPNWILNANNFQYAMSVIGEIKLDGAINGNTGTIIAGFMNDTLCAKGNIQYVPAYDRYEVFLSMYSNKEIGDSIRFQVYDANTGNLYVDVTPSILFEDGSLMGTTASPITFLASLTLDKEIPLNSGWTWISLPLASQDQGNSNDLFKAMSFNSGAVVKGQTDFDQYDATMGWLGTISQGGGFHNVSSYKVKKQIGDTLHLIGTRIHPDSSYAAINLVSGWNWIGFPSTKNIPLAEALGNYTPFNGDLIKSQYEFALYDSISNTWNGTLTTMRPGLGYIISTIGAGTFHYPLAAYLRSSVDEQQPIIPYYELNAGAYGNTMSLIVESNLCLEDPWNENMVLGAFDQDNYLRGYSVVKRNSYGDKALYFLTVHGNVEGDQFRLAFFDNVNGEILNTDQEMHFANDALLGKLDSPVRAQVNNKRICFNEEVDGEITVNPNPFENAFTVEFDVAFSGQLEIVNLMGKIVHVAQVEDISNYSWDIAKTTTAMVDGVYTLRLTKLNGEVEQKKVIKISGK